MLTPHHERSCPSIYWLLSWGQCHFWRLFYSYSSQGNRARFSSSIISRLLWPLLLGPLLPFFCKPSGLFRGRGCAYSPTTLSDPWFALSFGSGISIFFSVIRIYFRSLHSRRIWAFKVLAIASRMLSAAFISRSCFLY